MANRIPPHNADAEKSVLGAAMLDKDALYDVLELVKPEDFYNGTYKEIFEAIVSLNKKNSPVDGVTVAEELKSRKSLETVGGRAAILSLSADVPSTVNAAQYAKIVMEKAVLRKLIKAGADIMEMSFKEKTEPEEALDHAEREIFEIAQKRQKKDYAPLKDVLLENVEKIDMRSKLGGKITGIPSGFADLDEKTAGFQRSDLIVLAARPAMGKTAFCLNIAQQAALKGNASVLVFSMEMSKDQLGERLLAMESKIEIQKLKTGSLGEKDWQRMILAMDTLSEAKIFIDDTPGISAMEIKNKCRRLKADKGLDMIVVDYLQLMSNEGRSENRQQEISALSRFFKLLAREMDCPVIVLSQLSRAPEQRQDHRPILSDLRESGSIEQDADIVIFLYRDDYYTKENSEKPDICEVIIAKNRAGATDTVDLLWQPKWTRFVDKSKA